MLLKELSHDLLEDSETRNMRPIILAEQAELGVPHSRIQVELV